MPQIYFTFITNPTLICIIKGLNGKLEFSKTTDYFHMQAYFHDAKKKECSVKYDIIRNLGLLTIQLYEGLTRG